MNNSVKTVLLLGLLSGVLLAIGELLGGAQGLVVSFGFAVVMNFVSYWFSDKIVLKMYRAQEVGPDHRLWIMTRRLATQANLPLPLGAEPLVERKSPGAKPVAFPVSTTSEPNQSAVTDSGSSVDLPANDTQVAQLPQRVPQQQTPSTNPTSQGVGKPPPSDQRRQVRATTAVSRLITWDEIIRQPPESIDAMAFSAAGGMALSAPATRNQDGMVFHAGVLLGSANAASEAGRCPAALSRVFPAGTSAATVPGGRRCGGSAGATTLAGTTPCTPTATAARTARCSSSRTRSTTAGRRSPAGTR